MPIVAAQSSAPTGPSSFSQSRPAVVTIASWNDFFAEFTWPNHVLERISTNSRRYSLNYLIILALISAGMSLANPLILLVLGSAVAIFLGINTASPVIFTNTFVLYGYVLMVISFILVMGGPILGMPLLYSLIPIFFHMIFRSRTVPDKAASFFNRALARLGLH